MFYRQYYTSRNAFDLLTPGLQSFVASQTNVCIFDFLFFMYSLLMSLLSSVDVFFVLFFVVVVVGLLSFLHHWCFPLTFSFRVCVCGRLSVFNLLC